MSGMKRERFLHFRVRGEEDVGECYDEGWEGRQGVENSVGQAWRFRSHALR